MVIKKFYIYVVKQQGNIGSHEIKRIDAPGFDSESLAEDHLVSLIEKRDGHYFDRDCYRFVILPTYHSKSAFYLANKKTLLSELEGFSPELAQELKKISINTLLDIQSLTQVTLRDQFGEEIGLKIQELVRKYHLRLN